MAVLPVTVLTVRAVLSELLAGNKLPDYRSVTTSESGSSTA
jgi:hypothetical protein